MTNTELKAKPEGEARLRKVSKFKLAAFSLVPALLLVLVAEAGLRIARFEYLDPPNFGLVMAYERQVWTIETIPDMDVLYRFREQHEHPATDKDGFVPLHDFEISAQGYRGASYLEKKADPDSVRMIAYGDSVVFGVMLPEEAAIPVRLEKAMRERGLDFEALNHALPSYTSMQNWWDWEARGSKCEPDVLLLHFAAWNDFSAPQQPHTDAEKREMLRVETERRESWWHQHSRLVQAMHHLADKRVKKQERARPKIDPDKPWWEDAYANPELTRRVPLDEFKQVVQSFLDDAERRGIGVVIAVPALPTPTWTKLGHIVRPYHDFLRSLPTSDRVAVVDLQPAIDAAGGDALYIDFCHYNAAGTEAAAKALEEPLAAVVAATRRSRGQK